jgi:ParB-like chromosome segregation protein Spo0J
MTDFLTEEQKKEFLLKIKESGKDQKEVAKIVGVSQSHLSSALPFFGRKPRKKEPKNKVEKKVPVKWLTDFEKELELEKLRKVVGDIQSLTGGEKK